MRKTLLAILLATAPSGCGTHAVLPGAAPTAAKLAAKASTGFLAVLPVERELEAALNAGAEAWVAKGAQIASGPGGTLEPATDVQIQDVAVSSPTFARLGAAEVPAFGAKLRAFLREPAQQPLLRSRLWEALAGTDPNPSFTFDTVEATPRAFGAFGRVLRFRGTLKFQGGVVIAPRDMQLWVVEDTDGTITDVN